MPSRGFFRKVRITALLLVLFFVGMNTWLTKLRTTDWNEPLWVVIYPVNGDNGDITQDYIDSLSRDSFSAVESFLAEEGQRYRIGISKPVTLRVAPQVNDGPPLPPENPSTLAIMFWSLKLRYWAYGNKTFAGPSPDVRIFVVYHDPARTARVSHSLGIQKGLIGVVNAYAGSNMTQRNNVVIAHELLHTVGATDKYSMETNLPLYPHGYADPGQQPLHPQKRAEIMGGRIPLSEHEAVMPGSLAFSRIGTVTAREIRWID